MPKRAATILLALFATVGLTGCVYYNTFYHARTAYRAAEGLREARPPGSEPGNRELELLDRVVEKSTRVLRLYPDSEWADDALLLVGNALYHQGKYESAIERLGELAELYPDSEFVQEAEYMRAAVLLAQGNPVSAEGILEPLAFSDPPGALSGDALVLLGQARHARRKYEEAAEAYSLALERFPGSDRRAATRFLAAENLVAMGLNGAAAEQYEAVIEEGAGRKLSFDARIRLAEARLELGEWNVAIDVLADLERRAVERDELDQTLLLKGRAYASMREFEHAVDTYESITASHARSEASAEAQYRIGMIYRDHLDRMDEAVEAFQTSKREAPRSEVGELAEERGSDIEELLGYQAVVRAWEMDRAGSASDSSAIAAPIEQTAAPDSTGVDPIAGGEGEEGVAAVPDSIGATGDTDSGDVGEAEEHKQGAAGSEESAEFAEVAQARFRLAELCLFAFDAPGQAILHYDRVILDHPESELAPKAAVAIAWALENRLEDPAAATAAYRGVVEDFPGTEYADFAEAALSGLLPAVEGPGEHSE